MHLLNLCGSYSPPLAAQPARASELGVLPGEATERRLPSLLLVEIGTDKDHVHFLVQSVPTYSVTRLVTIIKSLTAREIFKRCPEVKERLWGGEFWTDGYFASTVGRHGNEKAIGAYVKRQGSGYQKLHEARQLALF